MNPDEHLTEEQKELLLSAEYFDRLNAATAYFPSNNALRPEIYEEDEGEGDEEMEGEGEGDEGEGDEDMEGDGQN